MCTEGGQPADVFQLAAGRLPTSLEWGEVLINIRAAPINPADVSDCASGSAAPGTADDACAITD